MRLVWVIALLLALPFSYGLSVESTGVIGEHPVLYGDVIAYERGNYIYTYDISRNEEHEIGQGANPSLFAFTLVFETKETDKDLNDDGDTSDTVIQYTNVRERNIVSTKAVGHHPYIFSTFIVFSTKESDLNFDFSNDGDTDDDIIREYDLDKKVATNLKAVGDFPKMNQRGFVFLTKEHQLNVDLNADGDKDDTILRILDKDSRKVSNTQIVADQLSLGKTNKLLFVSDGKLALLDVVSEQSNITDISGDSPSVFGDMAVFERNGALYGFSLETRELALISVAGAQPSLFENTVAFVSSEKEVGDLNNDGELNDIIRYAREEDIDGDEINDFFDNCPAVTNSNQSDSNHDGVGDACEKESKKTEEKEEGTVEKSTEEASKEVVNETSVAKSSKGIPWYWYLLVVVLIPFIAYYGYKYYKKKQKSFGF